MNNLQKDPLDELDDLLSDIHCSMATKSTIIKLFNKTNLNKKRQGIKEGLERALDIVVKEEQKRMEGNEWACDTLNLIKQEFNKL